MFIVLYLYYNLTVLKMKQKLFILGDSHFRLGKIYRLGKTYRLGTVHTGYMQILGLGTDNNSVAAAIHINAKTIRNNPFGNQRVR